jgi:hypothetical protein
MAPGALPTLARHRWHWTLDESNPERVSISAYARQVGRSPQVIQVYANGFNQWLKRQEEGTPIPISEALFRARMSAEKEVAAAAVAEANRVDFTTATWCLSQCLNPLA